jgi:hypothetical protein
MSARRAAALFRAATARRDGILESIEYPTIRFE